MFGKFSIRGAAGPLLVSSAPPKSGNQFPRNATKLKLNLVYGLANKATTKQSPKMNAQTKTLSRVATVDLIPCSSTTRNTFSWPASYPNACAARNNGVKSSLTW